MAKHHNPKELISLLVPFEADTPHRADLWDWLHRYWKCELPGVEIIVSGDPSRGKKPFKKRNDNKPFSKTRAVNKAFKKSHGDIIVILDADAYLPGETIQHCAERIRLAREAGSRLWFVPYTHLYRLTQHATNTVIYSDPCNPYRFPSPPPAWAIEGTEGSLFGHRYGALAQVMPREAFEFIGGMDTRFCGWGGEDVSFLRALDTLWAKHKNFPGDVLHLWHPRMHSEHGKIHTRKVKEPWKTRVWSGQDQPRKNDWLAVRYDRATNKPKQMRELVDQGREKSLPEKIKELFKKPKK